MEQQQQDALRKPFPKERIQKLPTGGIQLDYVSHAWVTDRLLEVDPTWTWEPVAFDEDGLPKFDENGGLWIRLTVCGVTRLGYGEPQGRDKYDSVKGSISNSLRNASMRFGVALDLWAHEVQGSLPAKVKPSSATDILKQPLPKSAPKEKPMPVLDQSDQIAEAYVKIGLADNADTLKQIWKDCTNFLDVEYNGTTVRAYIMQRKEEV
jgi:hypothetical protein